jgi:hypothetical protein
MLRRLCKIEHKGSWCPARQRGVWSHLGSELECSICRALKEQRGASNEEERGRRLNTSADLKMDHRQPFAAVFASESSTPDAHALAKL